MDVHLITLEQVQILSYEYSLADGDFLPMERLSFGYEIIRQQIRTFDAAGKVLATETSGWDLKNNKSL